MKKFKESLIIVIVFIPIITTNLYGQNFGFSFGVMKNYSTKDFSNGRYSFFPEISLSGKFFLNYTNWEIAFGYNSDGLKDKVVTTNEIYFNSKDYVLSSRLKFKTFSMTNKYIPVIDFGISYHIINSEPKVNPNIPIIPEYYRIINSNRFYFDIGLEHKIIELIGIDIGLRYLALIPLDKSELLHNQVKHSVVFTFKL